MEQRMWPGARVADECGDVTREVRGWQWRPERISQEDSGAFQLKLPHPAQVSRFPACWFIAADCPVSSWESSKLSRCAPLSAPLPSSILLLLLLLVEGFWSARSGQLAWVWILTSQWRFLPVTVGRWLQLSVLRFLTCITVTEESAHLGGLWRGLNGPLPLLYVSCYDDDSGSTPCLLWFRLVHQGH